MIRIGGVALLVLLVIYVVPFVVYGVCSAAFGLKPPEGVSPARFLLSVLVSKAGTAFVFVMLFWLARDYFGPHWLAYSGLWLLMFLVGEVGQAIGPNYSVTEALAGAVSELIYWPVSGYLVCRMLGPQVS